MILHHVAIRTADIMRSIEFYQLLGFTVKERFTAGYTLACWLEGLGGRLELMQIPEPKPAPDAFYDEHYVGYYHLSLDITSEGISLPIYLQQLEEKFIQANQENPAVFSPLKILLPPQQQMILDRIYEVAFIADIDNLPIEIIRRINN
jgi:catechol 2,3-dioxygenase-like lactoylglutathione lyase family enzyme